MKCLIVDDEFSARQSLVMMGRYKELGISEVLEAENGRQALEIAKAQHPEIVITDMKMSEMDGIGFLEALKKLNYQPQIIVISGFSDYSYMHSALHAEALDYVLKPIGIERFNECLERAVQRYRARQSEIRLGSESRELLQRLDIHNAAESELSSYPVVHEFVRHAGGYRAFLLHIQEFDRACREWFNAIPDLLFYTVQTEIESIFGGMGGLLLLRLIGESSDVVGLFDPAEIGAERACVDMLERVLRELDERLSLSGIIGLSDPAGGLSGISGAYRQARQALMRADLNGAARVFTMGSAAQLGPIRIGADDQRLSVLLRTGQLDEIVRHIGALFSELRIRRAYSLYNLELLFFDLLNLINALLRGQDLPGMSSSEMESKRVLRGIWQHTSNAELIERDLMEYLEPFVDQLSARSMNSLLVDMCAYVDRHYAERISLSTLSEKFFISREYASRIFKKNLGKTFVSYITEVRLKQVCQLLLNTDHSISLIADETGFKEPGYMIRVFRKAYGVTPKEYRAGK